MISDKASVCPHCGYPVGLIQDKANGNYDEKEHVIYDEVEYQEKSDNKKWLYAIILVLVLALVGIVLYSLKSVDQRTKEDSATQSQEKSITEGKYHAIIYKDNTGGFYAPNGGRICGLKLRNGRKEPLELNLNGTFMILGHNSDELRVSNDRAFSDYSDYLNYYGDYNPDKSLGVDVTRIEKDGVLTIAFDFKEGQIDSFDIVPIKIEANNNNEYTAVYYNDETGDLFDDDGSHICGFKKGSALGGDYVLKLSKTLTLYGKTTDEINIYANKVYVKFRDYLDDYMSSNQHESKAKAKVQKEEVGNAIIFHFSKNASSQGMVGKISSDTSFDNTSSSKSSSKWTGLSKEQLSSKLNGTVWTCRPTGRMWYRMEFKNGIMVLYYADPSSGKWHKDEKEWTYEVTEGYTSDTGEKCISAQIRKPGDTLSYGALIFFKNGDIEFNWLRGRQGGKAENKDFQWE